MEAASKPCAEGSQKECNLPHWRLANFLQATGDAHTALGAVREACQYFLLDALAAAFTNHADEELDFDTSGIVEGLDELFAVPGEMLVTEHICMSVIARTHSIYD